jgi:hypothetical protein
MNIAGPCFGKITLSPKAEEFNSNAIVDLSRGSRIPLAHQPFAILGDKLLVGESRQRHINRDK